MIALIRTHKRGHSHFLCELDIMAFSEQQVRQRMEDRGISDEEFVICGFSDWNVNRIMTLSEVYLLKKCIVDLYDGDDYIVRYLLQKGASVISIVTHYYVFASADEKEAMIVLFRLKNVERDLVVELFFSLKTWINTMYSYLESGLLLNTPKGFYIDMTP
ncbi:hypothetical protein KUF89_01795 [Streptococcus equi subsp. zooepidemicus]|uniref:hypothetical protein n=1 Tax=Streptococcus equi TaxID=1336 RepID=UPI001E3D415B|nr:hypothetical protein [Streptococcus equi]MCD3380016.1 hypothetical protein [Streptococcus equi subsp. zooepidemicus]MCD3409319.1 hypothetical protein [Streptococcus equi subsp. zooepidemicus]HEL0663243.1 hypothetical protein [Streptococcus equi subsp. zooepidemicus]